MMMSPEYTFETYGELLPWLHREWILTNGTGAFSFSTVVGANTRRYHGLLCAATIPPVGRMMMLSHLDESIHIEGQSPIELSVNSFRDVQVPRGDRYLQRFACYDTATWEYEAAGVKVKKEVQLLWGRNIVGIRYTIDPGAKPLEFRIMPMVSIRDFHALMRADANYHEVRSTDRRCSVKRYGHELVMQSEEARFIEHKDWWYSFVYPIETERGQDDTEDLFVPGSFVLKVDKPTTMTIWAGVGPMEKLNWDAELAYRKSHNKVPTMPTRVQQRLAHAAGDFVVARRSPEGNVGTTIIAGYPWFSDWGRDTMISLPGLLLATRRFDQAGRVLSVFAGYVSEGMIPNVFDDYSNQPHYNTVDASLWFIHAAFEYRRLSKDNETFESILLPACKQIVEGYRKGTRFNIHMDSADGLIFQGDPTTQLTWMDAKMGHVVFTPRHGKAVEINALWYNALRLLGEEKLANKVEKNFRNAFWINPYKGLYDVVNGEFKDESCRPNQIFAVSLPHSPLTTEQQLAVVEVVRRELLTPYGLRTLSQNDSKFIGRYTGPQFDRDRSYHNGAVWPWLIGGFLDAHLKVNNRSTSALEQARQWLAPLTEHLFDGCIGQIAEIYEGQQPYRAVGCCAQAWSVAETLRLAIELEM